MNYFMKLTAGILTALVLNLVISRHGKDFSVLLSVAACCMAAVGAITFLSPLYDFFKDLIYIGQLESGMVETILKAVGIGLLAEIVELICADAGNAALGKTLQIVACAVMLWISIPMFTSLLELVEEILVTI